MRKGAPLFTQSKVATAQATGCSNYRNSFFRTQKLKATRFPAKARFSTRNICELAALISTIVSLQKAFHKFVKAVFIYALSRLQDKVIQKVQVMIACKLNVQNLMLTE